MLATALQGRNAANIPLPTGLATFSQPQLAALLAPIFNQVQCLVNQGSIAEAAALVQREAEHFRVRQHSVREG
jgi:hypothetical protein